MSPSVNFLLMLVFIAGGFVIVVAVMLYQVFKGRGTFRRNGGITARSALVVPLAALYNDEVFILVEDKDTKEGQKCRK